MKKALIAVAAVTTLLLSSCAEKTPLTGEQKAYAGKWVATDGTYIQIFNDGGGSVKESNTSIEGGGATLTDSTITIGLMGIESEYHIDKAPYEDGGTMKMELNGNVYTKQ